MVVGLLGILKAGCAYVPLDPHLPLERLTFMVQDAGVPVVVTTSGLQSDVPSRASCRLVCIDSDWREIATESATDVALETNARDLAYVMYTSGSTGKPKGACITHRGLVNYLTWTIGAYDVSSGAAIPLIASIAFDLSVTCLFAPLIVGRAVHMPGRPYDVESILAAATDYSLLMISPAHRPLLAQAAGVSRAATLARAFIVGGEQLRGEALSFWRQHAPALRIINEFGPTETVVACCTYEVTPEAPAHGAIPIGRPIANTRLYVLDRYRQPVPIGVPGELYIGGVGVARGYWNRPELSAERFLADPFVADNEARLYRTGDLVRYRPDGNLEFLARLDSQVQLRGFRIELGEVEAVIAEHPGIRDVAVVVREDRNDDERLAAYIVSAAETTIDLALLRSTIRAQLPAYMVPSSFVVLDRLPLMANGKVDRRALPEPDRDRGAFIGALVPARDEIEQILCRVWAEILGVERVGIDDNFFDLGGHSLLAAKLFARLDKACGYSLPLSSLFAAPTVRDLADLYRQSGKTVLNSTLIQLTASGTHVPIYAVPGAYGNVVFYGALARSLGPDQPFYALEAVGLDGATAPLHSIEEIATFNLRQIRALQPHGPYIILGACFGATVAYEMAQQILSEGEGIALLGLFDPIRREAEKPKRVVTSRILGAGRLAAIWRFAAGRGVLYYDDMRSLGWVERAAYLGRKLLPIGRNAKGGFQDIEREVNQLQVYWANADAQDRYHRKPLASGDLRNFVVVQDSYRAASKRTDWAKLWTGRIDHYVLPGRDSGDLFRGANVQSIAAILAARLTPPALRARSPRPGSSW